MKQLLLIPLSIFLFAGFTAAQDKQKVYLVNIELQNSKSNFLKFKNKELIQLPLNQQQIKSVSVYNSSIVYIITLNEEDSIAQLWKYDIDNSTISIELELKGKISAFEVTDDGYECVIIKNNQSYILNKVKGQPPSMKKIENRLTSIVEWNQTERITVDKSHQLSITDTAYNKFRLLSNNASNDIYKLGNQTISFIYKFSDDYWYLKEYDFNKNKSRIIVRLPEGVDNYTSTHNGNFLCYDGSKLMSYNPEIDLQWRNLPIPFKESDKNIAWIRFLAANKMLLALYNE